MVMNKKLAALLLLLSSHQAIAADISLTMRAEKEVPVTIQGSTVSVLKPVKRIAVGDTLVITLGYQNNEDSEAYNINIDNPVPVGTRFIAGTGFGKGAVFLVSYDNGASYEEDIRVHTTPVTHLRWRFETLPAQATGEVGFQLQIERADHQLMR